MKKLLGIVSVVVFMFMVGTAVSETWISDDYVRVRDPQTHADLYWQVSPGETVNVLWADDYWLHIMYNGQECIVYKEYFTPASGGTSYTPTQGQPAAKRRVQNKYLGVILKDSKVYREDAYGKEYIGRISAGTQVVVRTIGKFDVGIIFEGRLAYVDKDNVQITGVNLPGNGQVYKVVIPENANYNVVPIRDVADKSGNKVGEVIHADLVREVERAGGWSLVIFDDQGNEGYIRTMYLQEYPNYR